MRVGHPCIGILRTKTSLALVSRFKRNPHAFPQFRRLRNAAMDRRSASEEASCLEHKEVTCYHCYLEVQVLGL